MKEDIDPLGVVEKMTGKDYHNFNEGEQALALSLHVSNCAMKKATAQALGDTYYSIPASEFRILLRKAGFERVFAKEFVGKSWDEKAPPVEMEEVWAAPKEHKLHGVFIYWETCELNVNSGHAYFQIDCHDESKFAGALWGAHLNISGGAVNQESWILQGYIDVREQLFNKLNELSTFGTFLKKWVGDPERRWIWLCNYMDSRLAGNDHIAIRDNKLQCMPSVKELVDL